MCQYTVYTRLRKPFHHSRIAIVVFQSLSPVPLGCNEISLYLWLPVSGKLLAIDRSLNPKGQWELDVGEDERAAGAPSGHRCFRHFTMVSDFQIFLVFQKLALWILSVPREIAVWHFKVILPSKTFFIFGISPVEHFSNFTNLPTTVTTLDLSRDHLDWLDIFLYTDYLFTQINILSKEAFYHHSECRISIRAANRSMH